MNPYTLYIRIVNGCKAVKVVTAVKDFVWFAFKRCERSYRIVCSVTYYANVHTKNRRITTINSYISDFLLYVRKIARYLSPGYKKCLISKKTEGQSVSCNNPVILFQAVPIVAVPIVNDCLFHTHNRVDIKMTEITILIALNTIIALYCIYRAVRGG